jgi:hypothetical protein
MEEKIKLGISACLIGESVCGTADTPEIDI